MSAVPSLRTWVAGELATSTMLNSNIRNPGDFFLAPPWVHLSDTADQSISNNTWTAATWNSAIVDNENMHPGSGGTVTVVRAGLYALHGISLFAANATGTRGLRFTRNGSVLYSQSTYSSYGAGAAGQGSPETACNLSDPGTYCDTGDTLVMEVFQNSGGALNLLRNYSTNIYSWFSARWVASS